MESVKDTDIKMDMHVFSDMVSDMDMDTDTDTDNEEEPHQSEVAKNLYEKMKHCVWVMRIKGKAKNGNHHTQHCTAFEVRKEGILMSCAHGDWDKWSNLVIEARPLCGEGGFRYRADVVQIKVDSDMCLFRVHNCEFNHVAKFGSGNLVVGEPILLIGHPEILVGSGATGQVVYPCTEHAFYWFDDTQRCQTYRCRRSERTAPYRIMGHIWNVKTFYDNADIDFTFQKNYKAKLPIVQCEGLAGEGGSSGGPMFNFNGEIIGMMIATLAGFDIGVHVTALNEFLKVVLGIENNEE